MIASRFEAFAGGQNVDSFSLYSTWKTAFRAVPILSPVRSPVEPTSTGPRRPDDEMLPRSPKIRSPSDLVQPARENVRLVEQFDDRVFAVIDHAAVGMEQATDRGPVGWRCG
jgi:hypothetical protein